MLQELVVVLRDEGTPAALGPVVLHEDGPVDGLGPLDLPRHLHPGGGEPDPLLLPVRLPLDDAPVAEGGDLELLKGLGSHVLHEGAMGNGHGVAIPQLVRAPGQLVVAIHQQEVVGSGRGEGVVPAGALPNGDAQGAEALQAGAVEDLKGGVRTDGGDDQVLVALEDLGDAFGRYH